MLEPHAYVNSIERKGWHVSPFNDGWSLSRKQEEGSIFLSISPHWLCLSTPLKHASANGRPFTNIGEQVRFYRRLLRRNEQMFLTKFGLDSDGDILLMAEIPRMENGVLYLNWALEAMTRYRSKNVQDSEGILHIRRPIAIYEGSSEDQSPRILPGISQETIDQYFRGLQNERWRIKNEARNMTWHLAYLGQHRIAEAYLTVTRNWTYFQVPALTETMASVLETKAITQLLFLEYLLTLNRSWFMAKIGITTDGLVLMVLELPTETLDLILFQFAIRTLAAYLDRYGRELNIMAKLDHDHQLVELLTNHR